MRRIIPRLFPLLIMGLVGLVFVVAGVYMAVFASRDAAAEAERVAAMRPLGLAAFDDAPPASEALIAGVLSERNPPRFRDFVAYIREEYRGSDDDGDPQWSEDERVTPPLLVDLGAGLAQIGNDDYRLSGAHASWQEQGGLRWNGFTGEGTKRYAGLVAGRPVMALGVIVAGAEGNALRAELVYAGTPAEYVAGRRDTARFLPIFGAIFAAVGAVLLLVGLWLGLRQ